MKKNAANPINPMNPLNPVEELFREATALVAAGNTRAALSTLFRLFALDPAHVEALSAASKLMALLKDIQGAEIVKTVARDPQNPQFLYDLGYHLINMCRPDAAKPFLEASLLHAGENPEILYELGYCNYLDRQFGRAADILGRASENLDPERSTSADLLRIECLLYADRVDEGKALLKGADAEFRAVDLGDTADALHLMFTRYHRARGNKPLDLRTWHFIQHGGVLLAQSGNQGSRGHFTRLAMNAIAVGAVLRLLKAVVDGLDLELDAVLYLEGGHSYTLALALGSILGRPVRSWKDRASTREILVLPEPATAIEAGLQPVSREDCPYIFCFQVFPFSELNFLPEFIGLMAYHFLFPWQERVEVITDGKDGPSARDCPADARETEVIAGEIANAARMLPEDSNAAKVTAFYKKHRKHLILSSVEHYPLRRIFHPLTPA